MSSFKSIFRNLRLILTREITDQISEAETRLSRRADDYERAVDARLDERFGGIHQQIGERFTDLQRQTDERADHYENALDQRIDQRLAGAEEGIDQRLINAEKRIDERLTAADERTEERLVIAEKRLDARFDEKVRAVDNRLDDRFAKIERQIDERFGVLDERVDDRMQRHERKVDAMIRQFSLDIVERNDIMLQIFEQRLDKQRRELREVKEAISSKPSTDSSQAERGAEAEEAADEPHRQLISFRKLANVTTNLQTRIQSSAETPLYHQILDWKKIAHEGLNHFSPDEQETADYILSFIDDPKELHYVSQHLRRFVSTLQRIPPAQRSTDRFLELGSLSHLAPAVKKYCGYGEVHCADFWDSEEKVSLETVTQKTVLSGVKTVKPESHAFELRNFNVERDKFPYPDGHFRVVLCCELIEHLQSDPMHMLWECNRVLEPDGWLLLTTPNIAGCRAIEGLLVGCAPYLLSQYNVREVVDQHNREYAPYEVGVALAAAGFTVIELETEDVWSRSNPAILDLLKQVHITTELRGDNIFALARKSGAPIERYPKELYID